MIDSREQTNSKTGGHSKEGARPFAHGAAAVADGSPPAGSSAGTSAGGGWKTRADELFSRDFWRVFLALSLVFAAGSFMNVSVFPLFDSVFTYARDVSVLANAAVLLAIGLVATFRPGGLNVGPQNVVMLGMMAVGCVLTPVSLAVGSAAFLLLGSSLLAMGRAWCTLAAAISCSRLSRAQMAVAIAFAFVAQCAASTYAWILPIWAGMLLFLAMPWIAWALTWHDAVAVLQSTETAASPSDFSITQPSSFLPLASQLFVCLFLFHVAFGCSLRFGEIGGMPLSSFGAVAPIALAALFSLVVCLLGKRFPTDIVVQVSVLMVVAGFLAMTIQLPGAGNAAVVLLSSGNTLFDMVAWMVIVAVASQNQRASVAAIAWGRGVSGLGTTLGAALGVQANAILGRQPEMLSVFAAVLVLCFVGYALIGLKNFSFAQAIDGVTPVEEVVATSPREAFEKRCDDVAERFGLTPRELEVFRMLARGRDVAYIQEQLTVSRNTVKAHVKHIYAKLDIHSHQDLIDLVEE